MRCAKCSGGTKIVDTRNWRDMKHGFYWTERRHVCQTCKNVFKTIEMPKEVWDNREETC
jgi:transcriptional regulator NrdR family protein